MQCRPIIQDWSLIKAQITLQHKPREGKKGLRLSHKRTLITIIKKRQPKHEWVEIIHQYLLHPAWFCQRIRTNNLGCLAIYNNNKKVLLSRLKVSLCEVIRKPKHLIKWAWQIMKWFLQGRVVEEERNILILMKLIRCNLRCLPQLKRCLVLKREQKRTRKTRTKKISDRS